MLNRLQVAMLKKLVAASAKYEGETNANGDWHGRGKLSYMDGTYYEGQFE